MIAFVVYSCFNTVGLLHTHGSRNRKKIVTVLKNREHKVGLRSTFACSINSEIHIMRAKVVQNESSREQKFQGVKGPGSESSRERIGQGQKGQEAKEQKE